jgi:Transposase IS116/IS110/IS902 family
MLELTNDLWADWLLELWASVPTPAKTAQARKAAIEGILKAHRIRRIDAAGVLAILTKTPLPAAPGATEAAGAHIRTVVARLKLNQQLKAAHRQLDQLCTKLASTQQNEPGQRREQRDVMILRSMPGLGRITLTELLAEASEPLRRRDYHALRTLSGVAPVTRRSGKLCIVGRRYACNKRLENAVYHWARVAAQVDPISRARYAELRRRGHSHGRAARGAPASPETPRRHPGPGIEHDATLDGRRHRSGLRGLPPRIFLLLIGGRPPLACAADRGLTAGCLTAIQRLRPRRKACHKKKDDSHGPFSG